MLLFQISSPPANVPPTNPCQAQEASSYRAPFAAWSVNPKMALGEVALGAGFHLLFHHRSAPCNTGQAQSAPMSAARATKPSKKGGTLDSHRKLTHLWLHKR